MNQTLNSKKAKSKSRKKETKKIDKSKDYSFNIESYCPIHKIQFKDSFSCNEHISQQHFLICNLCQNRLIISKKNICHYDYHNLSTLSCPICHNVYFFSKGEDEELIQNNQLFICNNTSFTIKNFTSKPIPILTPESNLATSINIKEENSFLSLQKRFDPIVKVKQKKQWTDCKFNKYKKHFKQNQSNNTGKVIVTELNLSQKNRLDQMNSMQQQQLNNSYSFLSIPNSDSINDYNSFISFHSCRKCKKLFKSDKARRTHETTHENQCFQCNKLFSTKNAYIDHCREYHSYYCTKCNKQFGSVLGFESHYLQVHQNSSIEKDSNNEIQANK